MFPRRKRLARASFQTVLSGGKRASSEHFSAVFSKTEKGYAVVVPKKVARLSVTRNKIKRRVFAAIQKLDLPPSVIIFPRSSVSSVSYSDMEKEFKDLISKMNK